jgi:uncharacterized protein (TIGR00369 family)
MNARTRTVTWADPQEFVAGIAGKTGLEFLLAIVDGTLPQAPMSITLGFRLVAAEAGMTRFRGEPAEYQLNPMGVVHGGWSATLLDSAMGAAVMSTCAADTAYTTTQLNIHLTGVIGVETGPVIAEGRVVQRGGRIVTAEGRITSADGRLLAHGTTTCLLMARAARR